MNDPTAWVTNIQTKVEGYLSEASTLRTLLIIVVAIAVAYVVIKLISYVTIGAARFFADRADKAENEDRFVRWRQVETYMSVFLALARGVVIGVIAYFAISLIFDQTSLLPATIGIGTFFIIVAGATIGPLLRDLTNGATMILGRWLSVGDFVKIEPFGDVAGVVERVTLRSTKLRNISGDVIWVHNQHIQGIRVTPRGVRSLAVDVFVRDVDKGVKRIEEVITTLPTGATMLASPLKITKQDKITNDLWRITITGQTAPTREWLLEDFLREALKGADKDKKQPLIVYGPLVRYADTSAEKRFGRAVHVINKDV
jgi:moderate conductance mechanosensitive channel